MMSMTRTLIAIAIAAAIAAVAASASAATTALCPASIAPITGKVGDRTSLGLDDGRKGAGESFAPGQLIVVLQPSRTTADLSCLLDQLRAVIVQGGSGKKGLAGLRNAVVLQLQPGVSVTRTAAELLRPRYAKLILAAQPNSIETPMRNDNQRDPLPNDELFPVQWGLSLLPNGLIPSRMNPFPVPIVDANLQANPFLSASENRRYSMRMRQAWGLMRQRQPAPGSTIRIAVVDDALVQHPDLEANVADDGNAKYNGSSSGLSVNFLNPTGVATVDASDAWSTRRDLCGLRWDLNDANQWPDYAEWIASRIAAQTNLNCSPNVMAHASLIKLERTTGGSLVLTYGGARSAPVDVSPLWQAPFSSSAVVTALKNALGPLLQNRTQDDIAITFRKPAQGDDTREARIVLYGHNARLGIDGTGLNPTWTPYAKVVLSDSAAVAGQVGVANAVGGTYRIRYEATVWDYPETFAPSVYSAQTAPIAANASAADVQAALQAALTSLSPHVVVSGVNVTPSAIGPSVFDVQLTRATANGDRIEDAFGITDGSSITLASPPTATIQNYTPRVSFSDTRENGQVTQRSITITGLPPMGSIAAHSQKVEIAQRSALEAMTRIDRATKWPGQWAPGDQHGQMIAGMIAATTNNGIGIAGVIGENPGIKLNGVVSGLTTNALLSALDYAESDLHAHVVNYSIGGSQRAVDLFDPNVSLSHRNDVLAREDPGPIELGNLLMGSVPNSSRTLFVAAAGNDGADLRRPSDSVAAIARRNADRARNALIAERKANNLPAPTSAELDAVAKQAIQATEPTVSYDPCRPKGMGIKVRPVGISAIQSRKGGTLSMLQMPDGTYDRGNLLCVANANWNGELAGSSNWGPGIVDVAAPGTNILGTNAVGSYTSASGTSFAAPLVAGVAAMIYRVIPDAQPWLVKCAILSSATTKLLRSPNPDKAPFSYLTDHDKVPYPNNSPLTVNGMVQASEAIDAAIYLRAKVRQASQTGSWPTCVQKRGLFGKLPWLGGWTNTKVLRTN